MKVAITQLAGLRYALLLFLFSIPLSYGQVIGRLDGSKLPVDSLQRRIEYLMQTAGVSGVAVSIFNQNQPVFSRTFGLADVPKTIPLTQNSVMYGCSFAKTVFAYIVMQLVEEKRIDLDKPLVSYLDKPLPDYEIKGYKRGYKDIREDKRYEKSRVVCA